MQSGLLSRAVVSGSHPCPWKLPQWILVQVGCATVPLPLLDEQTLAHNTSGKVTQHLATAQAKMVQGCSHLCLPHQPSRPVWKLKRFSKVQWVPSSHPVNFRFTVSGYPLDKDAGDQWHLHSNVRVTSTQGTFAFSWFSFLNYDRDKIFMWSFFLGHEPVSWRIKTCLRAVWGSGAETSHVFQNVGSQKWALSKSWWQGAKACRAVRRRLASLPRLSCVPTGRGLKATTSYPHQRSGSSCFEHHSKSRTSSSVICLTCWAGSLGHQRSIKRFWFIPMSPLELWTLI